MIELSAWTPAADGWIFFTLVGRYHPPLNFIPEAWLAPPRVINKLYFELFKEEKDKGRKIKRENGPTA